MSEKNLGYDVTSLDLASGDLRLIEVKGLGAASGTILLTPNERRVAEDRRDCYWLYVVTNCDTTPRLRQPIRDPARLGLARGRQGGPLLLVGRSNDRANANAGGQAISWRRHMIPKECKRLAEVDFPIAVVSRHAVREKSIRHGHPSTLHLWWARRPLASSRAVLLALLLPDPCDSAVPAGVQDKGPQALAAGRRVQSGQHR